MARLLAFPLPEHDGYLATVSQPVDVGRLCRVDLRDSLGNVLVCWSHSGFRHTTRPRPQQTISDDLRNVGHGLARVSTPLASLRDGLPVARGSCDAARALSPHDCQLRLRGWDRSRMACDDLSTLFRRGSDLRRLCNGSVSDHPFAESLRPGKGWSETEP